MDFNKRLNEIIEREKNICKDLSMLNNKTTNRFLQEAKSMTSIEYVSFSNSEEVNKDPKWVDKETIKNMLLLYKMEDIKMRDIDGQTNIDDLYVKKTRYGYEENDKKELEETYKFNRENNMDNMVDAMKSKMAKLPKKINDNNTMISSIDELNNVQCLKLKRGDKKISYELGEHGGLTLNVDNICIHVMKNGSIKLGRDISSFYYDYDASDKEYKINEYKSSPDSPSSIYVAVNKSQNEIDEDYHKKREYSEYNNAVSSFDIMNDMDNNSYLMDYIEEALKRYNDRDIKQKDDVEKAIESMNDFKDILKDGSKTYRDIQLEREKEHKKENEQELKDRYENEISKTKEKVMQLQKQVAEKDGQLAEQDKQLLIKDKQLKEMGEALSNDRQRACEVLSKIPIFGKRLVEKYIAGVYALPQPKQDEKRDEKSKFVDSLRVPETQLEKNGKNNIEVTYNKVEKERVD